MLKILYGYELKKLFFAKVNLIALAGAVIMLVLLVISSISEVQPVSREAAKELDGRIIDNQLIEELKPAMRYEKGSTIIEINADHEKYVPIMDVITSVAGYDTDLTRINGTELYELRDQAMNQRIEKQGLSEPEKEFWRHKEVQVIKPFVYHYHSGPANLLKSFQALDFFILLLSAVGLSGVYARETADNMNQHPAFVFVPAFPETVVDDNWNTSDQIETAVNAIRSLTNTYSIDENRIYTTGQSMGCMTSLYLNSRYLDLFAASLFVSGQWDQSVLAPLTDASFFYITAGGDEKASGGQTEVMELLDEAGVSYSYGEWSAQNSEDEQNAAAEEMISEGNSANFIRFETGSVLNGGQGMEHMASFNYAYKIAAVRDWLFEQTK